MNFPISFCNDLDKINHDFLWGSTEAHRKLHLVGWDSVTKPKEGGGLGIKRARDTNKTLLAKLNWILFKEPDKIWYKVIIVKYDTPSLLKNEKKFNRGSPFWKSLKGGWELFCKGIKWNPKNGEGIKFWEDHWVGGEPLKKFIHGPRSENACNMTIADV